MKQFLTKYLPMAGLTFLVACSPENELSTVDSGNLGKQDKSIAMTLSYELESLSQREYLSSGAKGNFAFLDDIASEPITNRQAFHVTVFEDGSADYLIEERSPKLFSVPPSFEGVPLDDTAPVTKTKITNGIAYLYDAHDNLMYQHAMKEDFAMRELMLRLTGRYNWEAEAKAKGATVENLNENTILIRKAVLENGSNEPAFRTKSGRYVEEVIVPDLNILLGSSLHEANGDVVSRMTYKYDYREAKDQWVPKQMYYEEFAIDEVTGSRYVSRTNFYFENYVLQTN